MNILSVVDLPREVWNDLLAQNPDIHLRCETDTSLLEDLINWPDVVFGNVTPAWARRAVLSGRLHWLQSVSAGIDAYLPLRDLPLRLTSARGIHHRPMAQYLLMMILALSADLGTQYRNQLAHTWLRQPDRILDLEGQQLGIIGFGGIARHLLPLVSTLGMTVIGISPSVVESRSENGASLWPMSKKDDLLRTSDHIVLSLPYIPGSPPILDADALNLLKPTAFLYNVARSQLIERSALIDLLKHRRIAGAALDVFEHEPLSSDSGLWDLPNVWITPHIAGHYRGLREASFRFFESNLDRYRLGRPLLNEW